MKGRVWRILVPLVVGAAAFAAVAGVQTGLTGYGNAFGISLLSYIAMAFAWNIISGYTGYISLGHIAFYGIGGYTAALLIHGSGTSWGLAAVAGGVVSALISLPLGVVMLRLRGAYFAVGTLALVPVLRSMASAWSGLTNGPEGIYVPPILALGPVFRALLAVAVACLVGTWLVDRSVLGLRLKAIRDDEQAARSLGVTATRYKTAAFVASALVMGLVGGIQAWYISFIDPASAFSLKMNLNMVVMALAGGPGTVFGPLVGAVVLGSLGEALWARFPNLYPAIFGLLVMALVLYAPDGLMAAFAQVRRLFTRGERGPGPSSPDWSGNTEPEGDG